MRKNMEMAKKQMFEMQYLRDYCLMINNLNLNNSNNFEPSFVVSTVKSKDKYRTLYCSTHHDCKVFLVQASNK